MQIWLTLQPYLRQNADLLLFQPLGLRGLRGDPVIAPTRVDLPLLHPEVDLSLSQIPIDDPGSRTQQGVHGAGVLQGRRTSGRSHSHFA